MTSQLLSKKCRLACTTAFSGAAFAACCSVASAQQPTIPATAQQADEETDGRNDIVVTASRRAQDITKVPYNIAVVGGEQLQSTGVSSVEDLSRQVPNLVVTSSGGNYLGSQRQIMRGLNASASDRRGVTIEQNAVSTYLDNAPFANFFPAKDIERVEVLRGPQGTLYGAGSLGGAIRMIPTPPKLGAFEGTVQGSVGLVEHSNDIDYGFEGVINVPLGTTLAVRLSSSHQRNAGFIDQIDAFVRDDGNPIGAPVLVDPLNVATSAARTETIRDVNWDRSTSVRGSLKWEPAPNFNAVLAHNYVESTGFGPNSDNPRYPGGIDPFDARITYPDTGEYEIVQRSIEPFDRKSEMSTLDLSYDAGFATLSSTSSYFRTRGESYYDATLGTAALPAAYVSYYVGTPVNPRFNSPQAFSDRNRVYTQEIRLVSDTGGAIDYTVGLFYQRENQSQSWTGYTPGQYVYNQAPGVTTLTGIGPDDIGFSVGGTQKFIDKAVFGEISWRATEKLTLAAGARIFQQIIAREGFSDIRTFGLNETSRNRVKFNDKIFKVNASYEYLSGHQAYATFSQGFRRGGANTFALSGFIFEPAQLLDYAPDRVDNFEIGVKGRFDNGWRYTLDAFLDNWHDPQIGGFTPYNVWPITVNGKEARTKGIEFELNGELTPELRFLVGYSYTDAKLTKDFCVPVGVGDGVTIDPCGFNGTKGTRLPSAPRHSGTFTLNYRKELRGGDSIGADFNLNFKGAMRQNLPQRQRYPLIPDYWVANLNLSWDHGPWGISAYVRNLFDSRQVFSSYARITPFEPLDLADTIGRPRQAGVALKFRW